MIEFIRISEFELLPIEMFVAKIKLITTGERSKKAFEPVQVPIEGLDYILDDPAVARGEESAINELLQGVDMLFVACSAGDGSEIELAVKIQEIARELEVLTIIMVQMPMVPESSGHAIAEQNLSLLKQSVDTLLIIPSEPLISQKGAPYEMGLALAAKAITEPITVIGIIRVDFADVRTVMSEKGVARMGAGWSVGENRAIDAAAKAISFLSCQEVNLVDARGVLIEMIGGLDLGIDELDEIISAVKEHCSETAVVVIGTALDTEVEGLHVTVIATGLDQ